MNQVLQFQIGSAGIRSTARISEQSQIIIFLFQIYPRICDVIRERVEDSRERKQRENLERKTGERRQREGRENFSLFFFFFILFYFYYFFLFLFFFFSFFPFSFLFLFPFSFLFFSSSSSFLSFPRLVFDRNRGSLIPSLVGRPAAQSVRGWSAVTTDFENQRKMAKKIKVSSAIKSSDSDRRRACTLARKGKERREEGEEAYLRCR